MTRNEKLLKEFTDYCLENPNERFWQALRNWWRGQHDADVNYILTAEPGVFDMNDKNSQYRNIQDTFYTE